MSIRDVLGDFKTDAIIEQLQELRETLKKVGFNEPRPWREFFAVFKPPKKWRKQEIEERITTNFFQYRSNYTIILAVLLGLGVFTSYTAVAVLCLVIGSYALLLGWTGQLEVFGRVLDRRDRVCIASAFSIFILLISGTLLRLIWSLSAGVLIICAHLVFRPRSLNSKANLVKEEMKLNGFLGGNQKNKKEKEELEDVESPVVEEGFVGSYSAEASRTVRSRS